MPECDMFDGSHFLLLVVASFLCFDFVFTNPDCSNCHTGIRFTVLYISCQFGI